MAQGAWLMAPGSRLMAPGSRLKAHGSRRMAHASRLQARVSRLMAHGQEKFGAWALSWGTQHQLFHGQMDACALWKSAGLVVSRTR